MWETPKHLGGILPFMTLLSNIKAGLQIAVVSYDFDVLNNLRSDIFYRMKDPEFKYCCSKSLDSTLHIYYRLGDQELGNKQ